MNNPSIQVKNLSKLYRLGSGHLLYETFRESMVKFISSAFNRRSRFLNPETIWALKDINFEVKKGQAIGIIGPNGSGKTTLLKILSRITEPTEGCAEIYGRISSLLEVGTGFHPELTGKENIYLNGSILGMRRKEINKKFDEIVSFAEVEKFIDTPVKHYSSGMYIRLAFAVAAHLETEILLVDEVLAVGDASFQKKCLGKMGEAVGEGKTVLFVSHNMGAIKTLTEWCIWLDHGRQKEMGNSSTVVDNYLSSLLSEGFSGIYNPEYIKSNRVHMRKFAGNILLRSVCLKKKNSSITSKFTAGEDVFIEVTMDSTIETKVLEILFRVRTTEGQLVFTCLPGPWYTKILPGAYKATIRFNLSHLLPGIYYGEVLILSQVLQDKINPSFYFEIVPTPKPGVDSCLIGYSSLVGLESAHSVTGIIQVESHRENFCRIGESSDKN